MANLIQCDGCKELINPAEQHLGVSVEGEMISYSTDMSDRQFHNWNCVLLFAKEREGNGQG